MSDEDDVDKVSVTGEIGTEPCRRHPDRPGLFGVTTHYIGRANWRDIVRADQTYGPLCDECRLEFNAWASTPDPGR